MLILDVYKVETLLKVYIETFKSIPNKGYCPEYKCVRVYRNSQIERIIT